MDFTASAPCKAILFGEHYVVYGSQALAIPIEPRNIVKFSGSPLPGIGLRSSLGSAHISQGFSFSGEQSFLPYADVAREILGKAPLPSCSAEFLPSWRLKGVGTSASLAAAFAAGLLFLSKRKGNARKIFLASQSGDQVAHQGRASGIDAKAVSFGAPMLFRRKFSPQKFLCRALKFSLPAGSCLLLIDTFEGKKDSTALMLASFARSFSIDTLPDFVPKEKREEIMQEFSPIIKRALLASTPGELGKLMDDNHILLRMRKVSSGGIEKAISAAKSHGAYGAKLTGGGGEGGAVLALCSSESAQSVSRLISDSTGFACHVLSIAREGARKDP
jgi:mevalonate kinase